MLFIHAINRLREIWQNNELLTSTHIHLREQAKLHIHVDGMYMEASILSLVGDVARSNVNIPLHECECAESSTIRSNTQIHTYIAKTQSFQDIHT